MRGRPTSALGSRHGRPVRSPEGPMTATSEWSANGTLGMGGPEVIALRRTV